MSHGTVVFDFVMPLKANGEEYEEVDQEKIKCKLDEEFNIRDPNFTERLRWMNLIDLPARPSGRISTGDIKRYLRADILPHLTHPLLAPGTPSTTYCYSGDQRICYHAFTLENRLGEERIIWVDLGPNGKVPITILIVLSYGTHLNSGEQSGNAQTEAPAVQ